MLTLHPYLSFDGNAKEALTFYQEIFGGTLQIAAFGDYGVDAVPADGVMHAELATDHFVLFGSDDPTGAAGSWQGQRITLALMGDDPDADAELATIWFARLAVGGTIGQPIAPQVWGDLYGQVTDRYGVSWMIDVAQPEDR